MNQTSNLDLIKSYYDKYLENPKDLDSKWRIFFEDLDDEASSYLKNNNSAHKEDL